MIDLVIEGQCYPPVLGNCKGKKTVWIGLIIIFFNEHPLTHMFHGLSTHPSPVTSMYNMREFFSLEKIHIFSFSWFKSILIADDFIFYLKYCIHII